MLWGINRSLSREVETEQKYAKHWPLNDPVGCSESSVGEFVDKPCLIATGDHKVTGRIGLRAVEFLP